jgi:hypothetical protein
MAGLDELKIWIDRDLAGRDWRIEAGDDTAIQLSRRVTSDAFIYTISANTAKDYLGCVCRTRYNAPGQRHPLFKDLPDGKLTEATWQAILAEIRRLEIQPFPGPAL